MGIKYTNHPSDELKGGQCQNKYGHGYMGDGNKVQLSVCEFITTDNVSEKSAKFYSSGKFLNDRYVKSAKIIGHTNVE